MGDKNNCDLIYEYAKDSLKDSIASLNGLNNRLASVVGIAGVVLRFGFDLHDRGFVFGVSLCVVVVLVICGFGIGAKGSGLLIDVGTLLREFYEVEEEEFKLQVIANWRVTIDRIYEKRVFKAVCLNSALVFLFLAVLLLIGGVVYDLAEVVCEGKTVTS